MAVQLDAAADRLAWSGAGLPAPAAGMTLTMWVRVDVDLDANSTFARLSASASTLVTFATDGTGTGGPAHFTASGSAQLVGDMGALATWVPVATTRSADGATARVFRRVGGVGATQADSGAITGVTGAPDQICIGGRLTTDAGEWLSGSVAHVRLWSAELTQAEIEAEWASATPVRSAQLVADWPLATASDLTDTVGSRTLAVQSGGDLSTVTGPDLGPGPVTGTLSGSLPVPTGSLAGQVVVPGQLGGQLPSPTGQLDGNVAVPGQIAGQLPLPAPLGQLAGTVSAPGQLGGALPVPTGALTGAVAVPGQIGGAAPAPVGHLSGSVPIPPSGPTAPLLPFVPGMVRAFLVADPTWTAEIPAARTATRAPSSATAPFAVIKAPPAIPVEASAGAWSPLVQIECYAPAGATPDPEVIAWRGAALAAALLSRARNVPYQNARWSARVVDGPLTDVDVSRGAGNPLYRALIRAELRVHAQ